jgi:8-oxo-dGTP pyrophosphatase MutT (NUDIX family)
MFEPGFDGGRKTNDECSLSSAFRLLTTMTCTSPPMTQFLDTPTKFAAGCVVYRYDAAGAPLVLLIHDKYGRWTLPKGHLEDGESEQVAAVREVLEETGLSGQLGAQITRIVYSVRSKRGLDRIKQVAFFLMRADSSEARPQTQEGICLAEWIKPEEALTRIGYAQVRDVLARALPMLP